MKKVNVINYVVTRYKIDSKNEKFFCQTLNTLQTDDEISRLSYLSARGGKISLTRYLAFYIINQEQL